ncbi:cysteine-rich and transmembrane domain-containing protein WIH2-like isoform X1 [Solanum pennellii]|uniref:Cysteine-rich and transmembrane domain-containing protein WIH2-like isoform X1 n=1 Tax=Solanum pennellii TaxID=28526 RepID=A0ABM1UX85_SOLPN|nr:cysteine-rich and transmembrane domain-containing protein WIH2-like isoform X1 [Solanum pennellii]
MDNNMQQAAVMNNNIQQPPVSLPTPQGYPPQAYPNGMYPPPQVYTPQAQGHGYPQGVGYYPPHPQPQGYPPPIGMGYPPQGYPPQSCHPPQYGAPPQGQGYPPQKQKQNQAATGVMGGWYVLYLQSPYIIHRCPPSLQAYWFGCFVLLLSLRCMS